MSVTKGAAINVRSISSNLIGPKRFTQIGEYSIQIVIDYTGVETGQPTLKWQIFF